MNDNDTIAAIATPPGRGGIAVLRVSGADALDVVARCWRGTPLPSMPGCGLLKFGEKYIPMDARMPKDSLLYQLFNTNFHEKVRSGRRKKQFASEMEKLPEQIRGEITKAPAKAEEIFPFPDEREAQR